MLRCKQWPRHSLNYNEYDGYYFCTQSLNTMTSWARTCLRLLPTCLRGILAFCLSAGSQNFPQVHTMLVLPCLAFLVGIIILAGSLYSTQDQQIDSIPSPSWRYISIFLLADTYLTHICKPSSIPQCIRIHNVRQLPK